MSIDSADFLAKPNWGVEDKDFDEIIILEKLKDVTKDFADLASLITEKFGSVSKIRIAAFNEDSGVNSSSNAFFRALIASERHIFYQAIVSNKECCVVFVYGSKGIEELKSNKHILAHEYAHHFQYAHSGFPYYICKTATGTWTPPFVKTYEVGPASGSAFIDDLVMPDMGAMIQDCNERISDIICEGLLREKGLVEGFLELFHDDIAIGDPALNIPSSIRTPELQRYVRRLVLRDYAEWLANIQLAYPDRDLKQIISKGKKHAVRLNEQYLDASHVFEEIFKKCSNTDFHSFKSPEKTISYTKEILDLLNIRITSQEKG